ncbi:hypothetical protein F8M41_010549 [Gigaspora margarita]|uniref:Uncharacterized protein n=1 Tax=Gigaspora margarita TaxID=4874 RepID=A0A8H3X0Q7_GIGMA|nr:hypothetical protein F8M41_010549 [Gigaspora margarita]
MSANATDASTGIDRSHDTKKYHTTVGDYQSDEIKYVNEGDNEKDTDLVNIDQQSQEIEEEDELQPKKRKRNVREKKNQASDNTDLQEIEEGEDELQPKKKKRNMREKKIRLGNIVAKLFKQIK